MERETKAALSIMGAAAALSMFVRFSSVKGRSMEGFLSDGDTLLLSTRAYRRNIPCRGDVVVVESSLEDENGRKKKIIKRVIGLPGEKVSILEGRVYIDGELLEEEYLDDGVTAGADMEYVVPDDSIFLMGDNREVSIDSRSEKVGAISIDDICGKVMARVWPIKDRKLFINEKR